MKIEIDLSQLTAVLRARTIETSGKHRVPHLASCLSCLDILATLYWNVLHIDPRHPELPDRDRFILSKGHAAPALFQILAERDFFSPAILDSYNSDGTIFGEHPPAHGIPGIEAATGSLGHGLPIGIGIALATRITNMQSRVFVLTGDGECNEGSMWEGAMMAAAQHLENLMVIVDYNRWQGTGKSEEVMALNPLPEKWKAFGWSVHEVNGHQFNELTRVLNRLPDGSGKPVAVIAHTVKGKGVSFMEDDNNWHYRIPDNTEIAAARNELMASEITRETI